MPKKEIKEVKTLKDAFEKYGIEYREGVSRIIDLAKVLEVHYADGETFNDVITKYENK